MLMKRSTMFPLYAKVSS